MQSMRGAPTTLREALVFTNAFLPPHLWPRAERALVFGSASFLRHGQRLRVVCFLLGNGFPAHVLRALLNTRLRDLAAHRHVESLVKDVLAGRYDAIWSYFDVNQNDQLYLNGNPSASPTGKMSEPRVLQRKANSLSSYLFRHPRTHLDFQHRFLTDAWHTNAATFEATLDLSLGL
jgi:hypothetical protein